MPSDRFDFDEVFGHEEDGVTLPVDQKHFLELDHFELMILVTALHSQWPSGDIGARMHAAMVCQSRLAEMAPDHALSFAKKLVAFHNNFHRE